MGMIEVLMALLFGSGRNLVRETVEVFRENTEAAGQRGAMFRAAALQQFSAEFAVECKGWFDWLIDGLNRVPRPAMAFGTIGLFVSAMVNPVWFATRMQGVALVPEPLWWLLGAIVSFYFGARYQVKSQDFQRSVLGAAMRVPEVENNITALQALDSAQGSGENSALDAWRDEHAK